MIVVLCVVVMDNGLIKQVDILFGIYEDLQSVYVVDFIGDVNIFEGKVVKFFDGYQVYMGEGIVFFFVKIDKMLDDG